MCLLGICYPSLLRLTYSWLAGTIRPQYYFSLYSNFLSYLLCGQLGLCSGLIELCFGFIAYHTSGLNSVTHGRFLLSEEPHCSLKLSDLYLLGFHSKLHGF